MDGNFDDVAISTFKSGLPTEHGLRKSLIGKPVTSIRQLMDWINKYKRVEEDQLQGKERRRLSLKRGRISRWIDTTIAAQGEICKRKYFNCSSHLCNDLPSIYTGTHILGLHQGQVYLDNFSLLPFDYLLKSILTVIPLIKT